MREQFTDFQDAKPAADSITAFCATDDADDRAAKLMLREIHACLRDGQPRQAIAMLVEATGVTRVEASAYVAELQSGVFGA
jgi:type IV secretory pathway VirJ component